MIRYALRCSAGHDFDAWFQSIGAFEALSNARQLSCPVCETADVERAIMAPAVARRDRGPVAGVERADRGPASGSASEDGSNSSAIDRPAVSADVAWSNRREILAHLRKLRDEVLARSDYVGARFADEARIIHESTAAGESPRAIHGEASLDDVRSLVEDGIPVAPIPRLPDDAN